MNWGQPWVLRQDLTRWTVTDMMPSSTSRRTFVAGLLAAGMTPAPTWADAGSPTFLSAAAQADGGYVLCGIAADMSVRFTLPLPARGHAAAAHPTRPEAVAFARRPGTFAVVIDCISGAQKAMLTAPSGRHFYGHGAYSLDGNLLFTTENDFEAGQGRIGVWDVRRGYVRYDEWSSGGIGPHDIKRLPESDIFVIANGGIDTHPDTGRTKLNIATMRPNLSYVSDGSVLETATLPASMHKNSIRHLAVSDDKSVAFGMQWEGDAHPTALVGVHKRGQAPELMYMPDDALRAMHGYIGSIAVSNDGRYIAATSPRGGQMQVYDARSLRLHATHALTDVCGVAPLDSGFATTAGTGALEAFVKGKPAHSGHAPLAWDNHLIRI